MSPSWRPQQPFPRIEEHTLSSQEPETKACLSFAQRLEQHWTAPSALAKSRQASIILMPFLDFYFVFEGNLCPLTSTLKSTSLLTLSWFPLLSLKDQGCTCILGRERELSESSLALCGECKLLSCLQVSGRPRVRLIVETKAVRVSLFQWRLIPCPYKASHIGPFCSIGSIFHSCGVSFFVRQLTHGPLNGICSHSGNKLLKKATQVLIGHQHLCELLYMPQRSFMA